MPKQAWTLLWIVVGAFFILPLFTNRGNAFTSTGNLRAAPSAGARRTGTRVVDSAPQAVANLVSLAGVGVSTIRNLLETARDGDRSTIYRDPGTGEIVPYTI